MKRILLQLCSILLVFSLTACGVGETQLSITIGSKIFSVTLEENDAANSFVQLHKAGKKPLEVEM